MPKGLGIYESWTLGLETITKCFDNWEHECLNDYVKISNTY